MGREAEGRASTGRSTFAVMALTMASRLLGIVRIRVFGSIFGAAAVADAVNFAFNVPNNFRKLFSEGALASALVPQFSVLEGERRQILFSSFLGLQTLLSLGVLLLGVLLRRPAVLLLSHFPDPAQTDLAIGLLPWFAAFLALILVAAYFASVLQSQGRFAVQAASPLLFSVMVIASLALLHRRIGPYSMALGAVAGALAQTLCNLWALGRLGLRLRPSLDFQGGDFRAALGKWGPAIGASAAAIVSTQAAFLFASGMGEGAVTAFSNSLIFWQTPYGIFFTAVSTVLLPLMGRSEGEALGRVFADGLKRLLSFLVPCAVFLFVFRAEAVSVVLQTGRFGLEDSLRTGKVLGVFLIGMPLAALVEFSKRLCYRLGLQKAALRTSVAVCALDIVATLLWIRAGMEALSLPLASLASNLAALAALALVLRRKVPGADPGSVARHLLKVLLACVPMALGAVLARKFGPDLLAKGSGAGTAAVFCGFAAAGSLLVLGAYRLAGIRLFSPQE